VAVNKVRDKFRYTICGNEVTLTKVVGGTLVCCGKPMEKLKTKGGYSNNKMKRRKR